MAFHPIQNPGPVGSNTGHSRLLTRSLFVGHQDIDWHRIQLNWRRKYLTLRAGSLRRQALSGHFSRLQTRGRTGRHRATKHALASCRRNQVARSWGTAHYSGQKTVGVGPPRKSINRLISAPLPGAPPTGPPGPTDEQQAPGNRLGRAQNRCAQQHDTGAEASSRLEGSLNSCSSLAVSSPAAAISVWASRCIPATAQ